MVDAKTVEIRPRSYVHLMPAEKAIWAGWMKEHGRGWYGYRYDVHVGEGIKPPLDADLMTVDLTRKLTQKRIDVTAMRMGRLWIFEVKPVAGLAALGQLMSYEDLYRRHFKYKDPINLAVVTDVLHPDEQYVYRSRGIRWFIVKPYVEAPY